jgi:predicted PurR-regulated permease PerM
MPQAGLLLSVADAEPVPTRLATPPTPAPTGERYRVLALAALTVFLIGLCVLVAVPFLPAITWGVALAVLALPLHRRAVARTGRPTLAAALTTLVVVVGIVGPVAFVVYQHGSEAVSAADPAQVETAGGAWRERAAGMPVIGPLLGWTERLGLDVQDEVRKAVVAATRDLAGLTQGSLAAVVQFLVAVFILYYLLRDRAVFRDGLRQLLPLTREESDRVADRAAGSVYANLYANLVTSTIAATGGGLMFWLVGLPAPLLWAVVMFVLSLLPVVGSGMVWVPAVVFLALGGHWLAATALLTWGALNSVVVDNLMYVRLAGERMRLHEVPALVAFLGGLAVFGVSGMILGPAILAVTVALLEVWHRRLARADRGDPLAAPAPGVV